MSLRISTSSINDGSMKSSDPRFESVLSARTVFLKKNMMDIHDTTLVHLVYEGSDYCRYKTLHSNDKGDGMIRDPTLIADALVVTQPGHALFLPLADCVGAVIHDLTQNTLMLSHLGRHNLEQLGGTKCIEYLVHEHGIDPANLTVWLSPAAGIDNYPLYAFDNRSLHDASIIQLAAGGVLKQNIITSLTDSSTDRNYFSHSQFLKGNRETDGRFAIAAVLN